MPRLDDLCKLRDDTLGRLAGPAVTDQNFVMLGRLLSDVAAQIDELGGNGEAKETALSEFEKRLRERESVAKSPRRAKRS